MMFRDAPIRALPVDIPMPWWKSMWCVFGHRRSKTVIYFWQQRWYIDYEGRAVFTPSGGNWLEVCPRCKSAVSFWSCPGDAIVTTLRDLPRFVDGDSLHFYLVTNEIKVDFLTGKIMRWNDGGGGW